MARALLVGPLQQIKALAEAETAERLAAEGRYEQAAGTLIEIVKRLEDEGLQLAGENLRERAAELYSASGSDSQAASLLRAVAEARVERGSSLVWPTVRALSEVLPEDRQWVADALVTRAEWPDQGPAALDTLRRAADESTGEADELVWLAASVDLLSLFGEAAEILARTGALRERPLGSGDRLAIELDTLDALEATGERGEVEARWLELLRWLDRDGDAYASGLAWQRRGFVLARREDVSGAHDAYRRAMEAWSQIPGYEAQAADAFFSLQSASLANAKPIPDVELRPLAAALKGGGNTPVSQADELEARGMRERLNDKLPNAKRSLWLAYAAHRRAGSLAGHLSVGERLGELYERAQEYTAALGFYMLVGEAKLGKRVVKHLRGTEVARAISVTGPRWERTTAYEVIGDVGSTLPTESVERVADSVLREAKGEADAWVAPQPALAAKRALSQIVLELPPPQQEEALQLLLGALDSASFPTARDAAVALVLATNAGVYDATDRLIRAFLSDAHHFGISLAWVAETAKRSSDAAARLREAALEGNLDALEVLALAELVVGDEELSQACTAVADRAATIAVTKEVTRADGGGEVSTSLVRLEGYGIIARYADHDARQALLDRLLEIATSRTDPETARASAANSIFNLSPTVDRESVENVIGALTPLALGDYELSRWDENIDHPLSRNRIILHTPLQLRAAAIDALSRLIGEHAGLSLEPVAKAVFAALRDGPEILIAAGFNALGRLTEVDPPIPIEAGMMHPDPSVRTAALGAYVTRHRRLPTDEVLESLLSDPHFAVRYAVLNTARTVPDGERAIEPLREDEDAYLRSRARQAGAS